MPDCSGGAASSVSHPLSPPPGTDDLQAQSALERELAAGRLPAAPPQLAREEAEAQRRLESHLRMVLRQFPLPVPAAAAAAGAGGGAALPPGQQQQQQPEGGALTPLQQQQPHAPGLSGVASAQ